MKDKLGIGIILIVVLFFVVLTIILFITHQQPNCELEQVLIQEKQLPQNWRKVLIVSPLAFPKEGAEDGTEIMFEYNNEYVKHTVYEYKNKPLAFLFFFLNQAVFFPSNSRSWYEYDQYNTWKLKGNQIKIQCSDTNDEFFKPKCAAVIQNGQYISDFSAPIGNEFMDFDTFKKLIIEIDFQMSVCK